MKIQIFKILSALSFFIIFGYFFGDEYWEYREQWKTKKQYQNNVAIQISDFNLDELDSFGNDIELYHTPYLGLLDILVDEIESAQDKIYVEVYIFTETNLRDALIRAHKRWVEVKILLENNPYKAPYLNDKHYNAFLDAGVDVIWSDPLNYSLNHSKLLLIDDSAYISTGNFSYSLFRYNRDFLVKFTRVDFVERLEQLFLQDFEHKNIWVYHENLVLSPEYSRKKLTSLLQNAQENIDFYFPYIADDEFQEVLFNIAESWVQIRWVVEEKFYKENVSLITEFTKQNIELHPLESDKLHAKAILVDEQYLYIGSVNFSSYSFDENREIGVIISDPQIILKFKAIFESDF
jgi:cardiolipin synthase